TVYRARDQKLSRTVAVKVMRTDLGEDPEFVAKFDREARLAATLSHPNLVSVFDQGTEGGQSYIVMEFVEGRTLRSTVTRECPIPPANMLEIAESVSSALAVAHDAGLVHRDIKPENVLISKRGEIKVTDFGLARQVTGPNMTATGVLVGTASYISPELVTKSRPDARSDVYSTGVMLYELLTGTKPHTGETNYQIAYAHVNSDIPAPSQAIKNLGLNLDWQIPDYVDALVQACTSRDPNLRPKDGRRLLGLVRQCRKALAAGVTSDPDLAAAVQSDALNTQAITPMSPSQLSSNMKPAPEQVSKVWRPLESNKVTPLSPASPSLGQQNKIFPDQDQNVLAAASVTAAATTNGVTTSVNTGKENGYPDVNSQRTPTFPISQHPVHRRRRGVALLAVIIIIALLAGLGSWWFMTGRYTT
ncbi:MAG: serine/threonine protein kinase, partial [Propionibacterium sp.]